MHLLWTPAPLHLALTRCDWHQASAIRGRFTTSASSWHKGATCEAGCGGGVEQVRLRQSGNGLLKTSLSVPSAPCLLLAGPAAGADGRKGIGVI